MMPPEERSLATASMDVAGILIGGLLLLIRVIGETIVRISQRAR